MNCHSPDVIELDEHTYIELEYSCRRACVRVERRKQLLTTLCQSSFCSPENLLRFFLLFLAASIRAIVHCACVRDVLHLNNVRFCGFNGSLLLLAAEGFDENFVSIAVTHFCCRFRNVLESLGHFGNWVGVVVSDWDNAHLLRGLSKLSYTCVWGEHFTGQHFWKCITRSYTPT